MTNGRLPRHARQRVATPRTTTTTAIEPAALASSPEWTPDPRLRSLTAASRRLTDTDRPGDRHDRRSRTIHEREQQVWDLLHVPEANYSVRFMRNSLSRLRLFPAVQVNPDEEPVPVDKAAEDPEIGLPAQFAEAALAETERMTVGAGSQANLMSRFGALLTAVGNSWVIAHEPDPDLGETWEVLSASNLVQDTTTARGTVAVKRSATGAPEPLGADPLMIRIWSPDPQWPDDPDTGMFSVLDELEELEIYDRQFRAIGRSRTPSGLLLIPSELDPQRPQQRAASAYGQDPTTDGSDQRPVDSWSDFELALMRSLLSPQEDDGSAASVVPHLIKGKGDLLEKIRHVSLDREIDKEAVARMDFLIRRIAHGVNLPVEVLLGLADSNHWSAWLVDDQSYRAHIQPTAQIPAAGLARDFLRPAVAAAGIAGADVWLPRLVYGIDPSALVVRPNRYADALKAHDRLAISDAALLEHGDFAPSDAPDDEEIARRIAQRRGSITPELWAQLLERTGVVDDPPLEVTDNTGGQTVGQLPPADDGPGPEDGGEPLPDTEPDASAITAAAVELPGVGDRLATIEARLRDRLQVAASDELREALRVAGIRLRAQVQGDPELAAEVNGQPAEQVGVILGPDRAPTDDTDTLLAGAFAGLEPRFRDWVAQAEAEAADVISARTGQDVTPPEDTSADAGWDALSLALFALAATRVFSPRPRHLGEDDPSVDVHATLIRDALAVAGGADAATAPIGAAQQAGPPGLLTSPAWLAALGDAGVFVDRWQWQTGRPSQPFPPHQSLEGVTFDAWDDPRLGNLSSWPRTPFFYPGDHSGCLCSAVPSLVRLSDLITEDTPS